MTLAINRAPAEEARWEAVSRREGAATAEAADEARAEAAPDAMSRLNQRRVALIRQKELSPAEQQELDELQAKMSAVVNAEHPLPFAALERLEESARQREVREGRE